MRDTNEVRKRNNFRFFFSLFQRDTKMTNRIKVSPESRADFSIDSDFSFVSLLIFKFCWRKVNLLLNFFALRNVSSTTARQLCHIHRLYCTTGAHKNRTFRRGRIQNRTMLKVHLYHWTLDTENMMQSFMEYLAQEE